MKPRRFGAVEAVKLLPARPSDGHKGSFGRLQIFAGSRAYPGAAQLSCLGAFKSGTGYVYLESEALSETLRALPEIIPGRCEKADAFVWGPGFGPNRHEWPADLKKLHGVIDGDGLPAFTPQGQESCVLTPHPGEAARLLGTSNEKVQQDRVAALQALAARFAGHVVLLKGEKTLIAGNGEISENSTGSVAMATAGQGDLLSGLIGGFLAQGLAPFDAARLGAYLHGAAADELSAGGADRGVLAHEVAQQIPHQIAKLRES